VVKKKEQFECLLRSRSRFNTVRLTKKQQIPISNSIFKDKLKDHEGMVTSVPPYETFSLIKNNIHHQSKNYKNHFENSDFLGSVCDL
jgi:hypothetical protein